MVKHSCFISYAHGQHDLMKSFVEQLVAALENYLEPHLTTEVYLDRDRLEPGHLYNEALAHAICDSACMIVVYTPRYERHEYCRREFAAMERVEEYRRAAIGQPALDRGFIIPVILAGDQDALPERIRGARHYADFSRYNLASTEISRNPEFIPEIKRICGIVDELHRLLEGLGANPVDCRSFRLPAAAELEPWRPGATPSQPFPNR